MKRNTYRRYICGAILLALLHFSVSGQQSVQPDCALWTAFLNNKRVKKDFAGNSGPQVITVTPSGLADCPASADTSVFLVDNAFKRNSGSRLYADLDYREDKDLYVVNLHPVVAMVVWTYRFRKTKKGYRLVSHAMSTGQ